MEDAAPDDGALTLPPPTSREDDVVYPPDRPKGLSRGTNPLTPSYATGLAKIEVESDGRGVSERGREEITDAETGGRV